MESVPNEPQISLELLVPWELPLDQHLSPSDRMRIDRSLRQLVQALDHPLPQQTLLMIDQALTELGEVETESATIGMTKTALKAWEVEDFDRYFQTRHVCTQQSATCLVKGLLVTYQRFIEIYIQTPWLDTKHVQQQKQGFMSYVHLLRRTFDLNEEVL